MHGMPQPGMGGQMMPAGVSPVMMQQASPQQAQQMQGVMGPQQMQQATPQQQQQQQQQQAEKIDNISKVKSLFGPLRESLSLTFKHGAISLQQNNLADTLKRDTTNPARFDKHLEDFYSYCDQIELHLKTAIQCVQQLSSAQHYLPGAVNAMRVDPCMPPENPNGPMSYPQYLTTVRGHVQSAKDIHDTLISAAQNISPSD